MAINAGDFNITEIIDSQQLAANLINNARTSEAGDNGEASQMLGILQQIRSDMQSMTTRIATLEKNKDSTEESQSQSDDQSNSRSSDTRLADHMDGFDVPMHTEPQWEDLDEEDE